MINQLKWKSVLKYAAAATVSSLVFLGEVQAKTPATANEEVALEERKNDREETADAREVTRQVSQLLLQKDYQALKKTLIDYSEELIGEDRITDLVDTIEYQLTNIQKGIGHQVLRYQSNHKQAYENTYSAVLFNEAVLFLRLKFKDGVLIDFYYSTDPRDFIGQEHTDLFIKKEFSADDAVSALIERFFKKNNNLAKLYRDWTDSMKVKIDLEFNSAVESFNVEQYEYISAFTVIPQVEERTLSLVAASKDGTSVRLICPMVFYKNPKGEWFINNWSCKPR